MYLQKIYIITKQDGWSEIGAVKIIKIFSTFKDASEEWSRIVYRDETDKSPNKIMEYSIEEHEVFN